MKEDKSFYIYINCVYNVVFRIPTLFANEIVHMEKTLAFYYLYSNVNQFKSRIILYEVSLFLYHCVFH